MDRSTYNQTIEVLRDAIETAAIGEKDERLYDTEFVDEWTIGFDELKKFIKEYPPEKVEAITWVSAETIREITRMYATTKPACISPRNALDQHTNTSCTIRATDILMAITGNLDVAGENIIALPVLMD